MKAVKLVIKDLYNRVLNGLGLENRNFLQTNEIFHSLQNQQQLKVLAKQNLIQNNFWHFQQNVNLPEKNFFFWFFFRRSKNIIFWRQLLNQIFSFSSSNELSLRKEKRRTRFFSLFWQLRSVNWQSQSGNGSCYEFVALVIVVLLILVNILS